MYLRLRKRRKPLPTDTSPAPMIGGEPAAPATETDWVPAESRDTGSDPAPDIESSQHPNRGKAHESSRGSHR
jgi:hypothetical protein